ncbi:MAG: TRAP-type mannitol/chloroaromatic compound transport system permease small subunit [Paracoccaceae bacterium]|jgi:TRAP-type mannitol/chloroaromatic compound transport system permease small subunit
MAGGGSVYEDDSLISRLDRKLLRIETVLALISGLAVFGIMIFAVVSVSGRNLINMPVPGYVDWIEQLMPLIAFMGVSYTMRDGTHIRMDILIGRFSGRWLWAAELITAFAALVLIVLLIWGSWAHVDRSFDLNAPWFSRDSSIDIRIPLWPAKLLVPVAFSVLALRLILQIWGFGRAIVYNLARPPAVPMIKSAAQQAADEAAALQDVSPT